MYKILLLAVFIIFSGCSYFTFNATMCDQIASDPHQTMPEECRNYSEEEAGKAFDKTNKQQTEVSEIIEFNKLIEKNTTIQSTDSDVIEFSKE